MRLRRLHLSATKADNIITATCSDWGCYGLMAALAYLKKDMEILHHEEMESEVMRVAARNGFIDMTYHCCQASMASAPG